MRLLLTLLLLVTLSVAFPQPVPAPTDLVTESVTDPTGIDVSRPRLSWKITIDASGWHQTAHQVQVASTKVASSESVNREYTGLALQSNTHYYWRVRVWDRTRELG